MHILQSVFFHPKWGGNALYIFQAQMESNWIIRICIKLHTDMHILKSVFWKCFISRFANISGSNGVQSEFFPTTSWICIEFAKCQMHKTLQRISIDYAKCNIHKTSHTWELCPTFIYFNTLLKSKNIGDSNVSLYLVQKPLHKVRLFQSFNSGHICFNWWRKCWSYSVQ